MRSSGEEQRRTVQPKARGLMSRASVRARRGRSCRRAMIKRRSGAFGRHMINPPRHRDWRGRGTIGCRRPGSWTVDCRRSRAIDRRWRWRWTVDRRGRRAINRRRRRRRTVDRRWDRAIGRRRRRRRKSRLYGRCSGTACTCTVSCSGCSPPT